MLNDLESIALATTDGKVTGLGSIERPHPKYKTPSYELRMSVDSMSDYERTLAGELIKAGRIEEMGFSIRSGLAQLGLGGFDPESVDIRMGRSGIEVETLVTDLSNEQDDCLMRSLRMQMTNEARIARLLLLPHSSKTGEVRLPLDQEVHYGFDRHLLTDRDWSEIWGGAPARQRILAIRRNLGHVPEELRPGQYLVGVVDANPGDDCWVLQPKLWRGDEPIDVLHDHSRLYDPRRTTGERQVEIRNINGRSEPLKDVEIAASVHKTNLELFHCGHTEGV